MPGLPVLPCCEVVHLTSPSISIGSGAAPPWAGGVKRRRSSVPCGQGWSVRMKIPIDEMSVMYA